MMEKKLKEIRLQSQNLEVRSDETEPSKMIVEGYPIVFDQEAFIGADDWGWFEKIDRKAFDNADMSDVCLKYNHNDLGFFILARTRNKSLTLTIDEKGVFMRAELIDTSDNVDVYKMVKAGLLTEGSFAFTVTDEVEDLVDGKSHRTILGIGKLFDVAICPNGAYGDKTEIYARSKELVETNRAKVETEKRCKLLRLKNSNSIKIKEVKEYGA